MDFANTKACYVMSIPVFNMEQQQLYGADK